jgi:hypothetical protein
MNRMMNFVLLLGALLSPSDSSFGANSVLFESKRVSPCAESVSVGVYITNDQPIRAVVIPIRLRSWDPNSFVADHFILTKVGRAAHFDSTGTYAVVQYYSMNGAYSGLHACPVDESGNIWSPRQGPPDFVSPDGVLYAAFSNEDTSFLAPGTDGSPGSGTPSLLLSFGVTCPVGMFEIDTTCVPPYTQIGRAHV